MESETERQTTEAQRERRSETEAKRERHRETEAKRERHRETKAKLIIIIIDNFCIALFSGVPKLTALYILQHFLSFTNIIHIIMTTNNV